MVCFKNTGLLKKSVCAHSMIWFDLMPNHNIYFYLLETCIFLSSNEMGSVHIWLIALISYSQMPSASESAGGIALIDGRDRKRLAKNAYSRKLTGLLRHDIYPDEETGHVRVKMDFYYDVVTDKR